MARQDEIQEVIAQGRMDLDEYDEMLCVIDQDGDDRVPEDQSNGDVEIRLEPGDVSPASEAWVLRSPIRQVTNSQVIKRELTKEALILDFHSKLVRFL